jgi:hypothetical protein
VKRFLAPFLILASSVLAADTLVMKSGEKYEIKGPSTHKNGRVTFTTKANRFYSVSESEVAREIAGPPPAPPPQINRTDSRQLGAIAREQRQNQGKTAPVAGKGDEKPKSDSAERSKKEDSKKKAKKKAAPEGDAPPPPPQQNR